MEVAEGIASVVVRQSSIFWFTNEMTDISGLLPILSAIAWGVLFIHSSPSGFASSEFFRNLVDSIY